MNILIVIQCRMGSKRMPGKALLKLHGRTLVEHVMAACRKPEWNVCVAVPKGPENEVLINELEMSDLGGRWDDGRPFYRFSLATHIDESDVLTRIYDIASQFNPDHVIRVTGDCPMLSTEIIESVLRLHLTTDSDFTYNSDMTQGDGIDVEVMKMHVLREAHLKANTPYEREHVTDWIRHNTGLKLTRSGVPGYPTRSINVLEDFVWVHKNWRKE